MLLVPSQVRIASTMPNNSLNTPHRSFMKLMILNLPRSYTENELAKLFKLHGNIRSCTIVMDPKTEASKGFGFVEMALAHEAEAAIKKLNGSILAKNKIRVKVAD